jgi:hypothetical protein
MKADESCVSKVHRSQSDRITGNVLTISNVERKSGVNFLPMNFFPGILNIFSNEYF